MNNHRDYGYLFGHDELNDFLMQLLTASKSNPKTQEEPSTQKENIEQSAESFLEDGRLVVFDDHDQLIYTLYLQEQFLPISTNDVGKEVNLTMEDIVAIYEYPISEINSLFWNQKPDEDLLDHPVWKKDQKDIDKEIEELKERLKKLQARKTF